MYVQTQMHRTYYCLTIGHPARVQTEISMISSSSHDVYDSFDKRDIQFERLPLQMYSHCLNTSIDHASRSENEV